MCCDEVNTMLAEISELVEAFEHNAFAHAFPQRYCKTRWSGLHTSALSLCKCWMPLNRMKAMRCDEGFGPPKGGGASTDDFCDDGSDSDTSSDNVDGFCNNEIALFNLDNTTTGNPRAAKDKRNILLHKAYGITDLNHGLNSMLATVLNPVSLAIRRLQTVAQPIQHKVNRVIEIACKSLDTLSCGVFTGLYDEWRRVLLAPDVGGKCNLVLKVDEITILFAAKLAQGIRDRFSCTTNPDVGAATYTNYFKCFELIDPALNEIDNSDGKWLACEEICRRCGLNYRSVREEIITMHDYTRGGGISYVDFELLKKNLLRWYHKKGASQWPAIESFARVIFSIAWETVLAEGLFSYLKLNKSGHRSTLSDKNMDNILHVTHATDAVDATAYNFMPPSLDTKTALTHELKF